MKYGAVDFLTGVTCETDPVDSADMVRRGYLMDLGGKLNGTFNTINLIEDAAWHDIGNVNPAWVCFIQRVTSLSSTTSRLDIAIDNKGDWANDSADYINSLLGMTGCKLRCISADARYMATRGYGAGTHTMYIQEIEQ